MPAPAASHRRVVLAAAVAVLAALAISILAALARPGGPAPASGAGLQAGAIAAEAAAAAEALAGRGVEATVLVVASLAPAPTADLLAALARHPLALTVEAHYAVGGLGSLVAETVADHGMGTRVVRCAVERASDGVTGGQPFLHGRHGLSAERLVQTALRELDRAPLTTAR